MVTTKYFKLQELVHPSIYLEYGEKCWEFLQVPALLSLDQLREAFGPLIINTWHEPKLQAAWGLRQFSGLRPFDSKIGAEYSQHKLGGAFDIMPINHTADQMRDYVLANRDEFPYITTVEVPSATKPMNWFHFDVRNTKPIKTFTP